jgi:methylenetetrahydrofolate dehydrogenase (NADP+)/methenyltetrahydrofolate cyclohydrolase
MSAHVLDGRELGQRVRAEVAAEVDRVVSAGRPAPGLATVLVGADPASEVYVRNKRRAMVEAGMEDHHRHLPASVTQEQLLDVIDELAADTAVHGILVQLPLPDHLDETEILAHIPAAKDVDGLTVESAGLLAQGRPGLRPCTPSGVIRMLDDAGVDISGARAAVVGRSILVGRPMAQLLLQRDATVTMVHSKTVDSARITREADIVVVASGVPSLVDASWIKTGATVIDVGIHRGANGLEGDVNFADVSEVAGKISPVPRGVGPMTIAMLLVNTLDASKSAY